MAKYQVLLVLCLYSFSGLAQSTKKELFINDDNYAWKYSTGIKNTDQQCNLSNYLSPNLRDGQAKDKTVIMAASGGGLRAAGFAIGTLLELERIGEKSHNDPINVANEIDYFSTVSGGGWGVSSFIAYRYTLVNKIQSEYKNYNEFEEMLSNWVDRSYAHYQFFYAIGGIIFGAKFNERSSETMINRLNYGYLGYGYLEHLTDSMHRGTGEISNRALLGHSEVILLKDVFTPVDSKELPKLPMLIANTTNISTLSLLPFTPDRLKFWGVRQYYLTNQAHYPDEPSNKLTDRELLEVPLADGIKASSSVPDFIGATKFPSERDGIKFNLYLEDGGIVDNQGLHTVKSILRQTENEINRRDKRIVFVVDAAQSGIDAVRPQFNNLKRAKNLKIIAVDATPDAQYSLMREDLETFGNDNNCTVIYLGTEVLLNPTLGLPRSHDLGKTQKLSRKEAEKILDKMADEARADPNYFLTKCSYENRRILYEYIRSYIKTWFSAKGSLDNGETISDPSETTGYGKYMILAGRAVVQLQASAIRAAVAYPEN